MEHETARRDARVDRLVDDDEVNAQSVELLRQRDEMVRAAREPVELHAGYGVDLPSSYSRHHSVERWTSLAGARHASVDILLRLPPASRDERPEDGELVFGFLIGRRDADVDRRATVRGRHAATC